MTIWKNKLYFGDNLNILRESVKDESVDLVYLDPPFNSKATYNVLFEEKDGQQSDAQITAFEDTWHWGDEAEASYVELVEQAPIQKLSHLMVALRSFLGRNDMLAYLTMMAIRLVELRRVLASHGSLYLHCDATASHYLKLLLDAIFGGHNFRAEIVWRRMNAKGLAFKGFPKNHDIIFYYTVSNRSIWNRPFAAHDIDYLDTFYKYTEEGTGRRFRISDLSNPNKNRPNLTYEWNGHHKVWRWEKPRMIQAEKSGLLYYSNTGLAYQKRYLDEMKGQPIDTIWDDIPPIQAQSSERLGYPTQKPEALLERIIKTSSNEGDLVLDPFCGCGTTITVAERLKRRWVGIDITHLAVTLMKNRLDTTFTEQDLSPYEVLGTPVDVGSARALARDKPFEFEYWALGLVDARPARDKKKGGDSGVDGIIYFFDDMDFTPKKIIVQVKGGEHIGPNIVRDLRATVDREQAVIGILITLRNPTKPMKTEALSAGYYTSQYFNRSVPKIQMLTIEDILAGSSPEYYRVPNTFKAAPRKFKNDAVQTSLIDN